MATEATATATDTALPSDVETAMHAVFGTSPMPTGITDTGGPPDASKGEVEVSVDDAEEAPATRRDAPQEREKVVPLARIKDRLERQRNEVEGILTQAQGRHAEAEAREAQAEAREKALRDREELLEILDSGDPAEYFARTKKDPREFLERLARSGQPEAKETARLTKLERENAAIKAELEHEKAERENGRKRQAEAMSAQQRAAQREQAEKNFVALISPETHPTLTENFDPHEVASYARGVLAEIVGHDEQGRPVNRAQAFEMRYGKPPDDVTVAGYLEAREVEKKATRAKNLGGGWTKKPTTAADGPTISPRPKERGSRQVVSDTRTQTANPTQEEIDRQSIAILEAAIKNSKKEE